jgi:hypothetical protein
VVDDVAVPIKGKGDKHQCAQAYGADDDADPEQKRPNHLGL